MKAIKQVMKKDQEPYRVPKRVQDVIPIKCMWSDGIFLVGTRYSKTFKFTDINYMVASQDAQKKLFLSYAALINSLDCSATTKITVNNRHLNRKNFADTVLMRLKNDYLDYYRMEYNDVIMSKATGGNGIIQEKYVTVSVCKKNIEDARAYFARAGAELTARFAALGAKATEMDTTEKLRVLHDFYRSGEEVYFHFDARDMMRKGHDFRDYICPDSIENHSDYLMLGGKYARVIYLKDYASFISDQLVTKLTDQSRNMMLSIDIIPVATDEAVKEVERKMLGVETNITNWQRRQNTNAPAPPVLVFLLRQYADLHQHIHRRSVAPALTLMIHGGMYLAGQFAVSHVLPPPHRSGSLLFVPRLRSHFHSAIGCAEMRERISASPAKSSSGLYFFSANACQNKSSSFSGRSRLVR